MKIFSKVLMMTISGIMLISNFMMPMPVFAAGTCEKEKFAETAIMGEDYTVDGKTKHGTCDDGKGGTIKDVLQLVVEIMSIGIGILGVLGITIVGIQYLTAGGSEEKTRKAKRRMLEIVIGIIAYVLFTAFLSFLIPDFKAFSW